MSLFAVLIFLFKCLQPDFDGVVDLLAREATRTICGLFSQLLSQNASLKTRVGRLEGELKTAAETVQRSNLWRENVLSGCPVLFQDSGLVFSLKPLGKLTVKSNPASEGDHQASPAAGLEPGEQTHHRLQEEFSITKSCCTF